MIKSADYTKQHELDEAKIAQRSKELLKEDTPKKMQLLQQIMETELQQYRYISLTNIIPTRF